MPGRLGTEGVRIYKLLGSYWRSNISWAGDIYWQATSHPRSHRTIGNKAGTSLQSRRVYGLTQERATISEEPIFLSNFYISTVESSLSPLSIISLLSTLYLEIQLDTLFLFSWERGLPSLEYPDTHFFTKDSKSTIAFPEESRISWMRMTSYRRTICKMQNA